VAQLGEREKNLQKELADLQSDRSQLAAAVEEGARGRYERLTKSKGENVHGWDQSWRLWRLPHETAGADAGCVSGQPGTGYL
jgi:hypothetical protein